MTSPFLKFQSLDTAGFLEFTFTYQLYSMMKSLVEQLFIERYNGHSSKGYSRYLSLFLVFINPEIFYPHKPSLGFTFIFCTNYQQQLSEKSNLLCFGKWLV